MKNKLRIILYALLGIMSFAFFSLFFLAMSFFPIIRAYTVNNRTNQTLFVTPLMEFGGKFDFEAGDAENDTINAEKIPNLSVLSQFTSYSNPTFPAPKRTDLEVKPLSKRVIYIDYEDLKQEEGLQVLLVKTTDNRHYYTSADFWSHTTVSDLFKLTEAPELLVEIKEQHSPSFFHLYIISFFFLLSAFFFFLVFKNIRSSRVRRADMQT